MSAYIVAGVVLLLGCCSQPQAAESIASDTEIREILRQRVGNRQDAVGMVVGIVEPQGRRIIAYGSARAGATRPLDGDTVFEIGSISKVFTALLLSDLVTKREATLDTPVGRYLPPEARVPERNGRSITLVDLATHTSGLPREPTNMRFSDWQNPYASYPLNDLYAFLSTYALTRDPGAGYEYSNLGMGLLGHALTRATGESYAVLVEKRIAKPLGLSATTSSMPDNEERLATGHNASHGFVETVAWDAGIYEGAGSLRSSANDMLTFLSAYLSSEQTPLKATIDLALSTRRPATFGGQTTLGWYVMPPQRRGVLWRNGGTAGFNAFAGFDPARGIGVVVLTNVSTRAGVDDIGHHLLNPEMPLATTEGKAPQPRAKVVLDQAQLDKVAGTYRISPSVTATVTREGSRLFVQITGQARAEVFAASERDFFYEIVDAQISFAWRRRVTRADHSPERATYHRAASRMTPVVGGAIVRYRPSPVLRSRTHPRAARAGRPSRTTRVAGGNAG